MRGLCRACNEVNGSCWEMSQEQVRIFIDLTDFEHLTQARTAINLIATDPDSGSFLHVDAVPGFLDHVLVEGASHVYLFPEHFRTRDLRPSSMSPGFPVFEYTRQ